MTKQAIGLFLFAVLASAGGCNVCRAILYDPFGPNTMCDARRCGPLRRGCQTCGPVCDEPCGPVVGGGYAVEPCDDGGCGYCGEVGCYGRCRPILRGPVGFLFRLFGFGPYGGCDGCGERYWGDWYGDPPDCNDPCDYYGNYMGGGCSTCGGGGMAAGIPSGYEGPAVSSGGGGCRSCGQGGTAMQSRGATRYPAQYASSPQMSPTQGAPTNGWVSAQRSPNRYPSTRSPRTAAQYASGSPHPAAQQGAGPYAPRLISTTDRAATPATPEQGPRLAQPQRADVWQE